MVNFVAKIQKDLTALQTTLNKEGQAFFKTIKGLKVKKEVAEKRKNLELLFKDTIKRFEPSYKWFLKELKSNAKKAGIDVSKIEKDLIKNVKKAKKTLEGKLKTTTKTTRGKKPTKAAAAPVKKSTKPKKTTGKAKATAL